MAVHRHRSPGLWVPGQKPLSSSVVLDKSSDLAAGLSDLILFDGGRRNPNLATPAYPAVTTGNPTSEIIPSVGLALRTPGANTDYQEVPRTDYNIAAADATISILFQPQAWAGAFNDVLSKNSEFGFYTDTTGAVNAYNVGGAVATAPTGVNVAVGETARLTIVRVNFDTTATTTWYKNGVRLSSTSDAVGAAVAGSTWKFGRDFGTDTPSNIRWADFFVWSNRALTASEVARHNFDPYSMLRPVFIPRRTLPANITLPIKGNSLGTARGALSPATNAGLVLSNAIAASSGLMVPGTDVESFAGPSLSSIYSSIGYLSSNLVTALGGNSLGTAAGSLLAPLVGNVLGTSVGTPAAAISTALTGSALGLAAGTPDLNPAGQLVGNALGTAVGAILAAPNVPLTGIAAGLTAGAVAAALGGVASLTGNALGTVAGAISPATDKALLGRSLGAAAGTVAVGGSAIIALTGSATRVAIGTINPPPPPPPITDMTFTQTGAIGPSAAYKVYLGRVKPIGGIGPFTYSVSGPYNYEIQQDGLVDMPYDSPTAGLSTDTLAFTIVDGMGSTFTKSFTVNKVSTDPFLVLSHNGLDDPNCDAPYFQQLWTPDAFGPGFGPVDVTSVTFIDPSGLLSFITGQFRPSGGPMPTGSYPLHVEVTSGAVKLVGDYIIVIAPMPTIGPMYFNHGTLSTIIPYGYVLGTVLCTTPSNGRNFTLGGPDAASFNISIQTGGISPKAPLTARQYNISVTVTDRLATRTDALSFTVIQGTLLPSSNMSFTAAGGLDNWQKNQTIGTPVCGGIPSGSWTVTSPDDTDTVYVTPQVHWPMFVINPTTGLCTSFNMLPNRVLAPTFTLTDGITRCTATFSVPVAWRVGPTFHVGQGMSALYGAGVGFEHVVDIKPLFQGDPGPINAGAEIIWHANPDPNYYANDTGNGVGANYWNIYNDGLRFSWYGPLKFTFLGNPRIGGVVGSTFGGDSVGTKGCFDCWDGDFVFTGPAEISFCQQMVPPGLPFPGDNSHGVVAIHKNADTWGDYTVNNIYIHDCNQGIASGDGPFEVSINNCVITGCGTSFGGGGFMHNCYINVVSKLTFTNNRSFGTIGGHTLKSRARIGVITGNLLADGERGSGSCQIDMPFGGTYLVENNEIQKGASPQNKAMINWCAEIGSYGDSATRVNTLTVRNNRFTSYVPYGNRNAVVAAVVHYGVVSSVDGSQSQVDLINNSFYLFPTTTRILNDTNLLPGGAPVPPAIGAVPVNTDNGSIVLTSPPRLVPSGSLFANRRTGPLLVTYDTAIGNPNQYINFEGVQIYPDADDIRVAVNSPIGTTISVLTAYGNNIAKNVSLTDPRINPFGPGTTWAIVQDKEYAVSPLPVWAPAGRYAITANPDGTGLFAVASGLATGVDEVKIRATGPAPGSVLCDYRMYIVVTLADPNVTLALTGNSLSIVSGTILQLLPVRYVPTPIWIS